MCFVFPSAIAMPTPLRPGAEHRRGEQAGRWPQAPPAPVLRIPPSQHIAVYYYNGSAKEDKTIDEKIKGKTKTLSNGNEQPVPSLKPSIILFITTQKPSCIRPVLLFAVLCFRLSSRFSFRFSVLYLLAILLVAIPPRTVPVTSTQYVI